MVDREKVIKGLEIILHGCDDIQCWDCEFRIKTPATPARCGFDKDQIEEAALAMLKEQEAVEPIKKDTVEITARYEFDCPCGAPLLIGQPYCADCGKLVKWE